MFIIIFGTRPEYIKLKPLMTEMRRIPHKSIYVRQHEDLLRGCDFDCDIPIPREKNNRLKDILATCQFSFPPETKGVIVQGDTSTASSCALSAFYDNIPVLHVEAGLRTYRNDPFPEEANRRIISSVASYHFAPSLDAYNNLRKEKVNGEIFLVGNTGLDDLFHYKITSNNTVIVTMHRRDNLKKMRSWFEQIDKLACKHKDLKFVFPMHPNPEIQKHKDLLKNVLVLDPVDHESMAEMLASCRLAITDSGGIQEECSFFGKWCLVCRDSTERPCDSSIIVDSPYNLGANFEYCLNRIPPENTYPFGDGHASERIVKVIKEKFYE